MRQRWIAYFALILLCGIAVWGAYMYWAPLKGQFGGGGLTNPPIDVLQEACSLPLAGGSQDDPTTYYINEFAPSSRGPVIREGCLVEYYYGLATTPTSSTCQVGVCDGTRNKSVTNSGYGYHSYYKEAGPCDYKWTTTTPDCRPERIDSEVGDSCSVNEGISVQSQPRPCCRDSSYIEDPMTVSACASSNCVVSYVSGSPFGYYSYACTDCSALSDSDWTYEYVPYPAGHQLNPNGSSNIGYCKGTYLGGSSSSAAPECGNGTKDSGEECDNGDKNIPSDVANKTWSGVTLADVSILTRSSCLDTCKIAQCSDRLNNDGKNGADDQDRACYGGPYGDVTYLPGYNVEKCPACLHEEPKDKDRPTALAAQLVAAVGEVYQNGVPINGNGGIATISDKVKNYYCTDGKDINFQDTGCNCRSNTVVQFMDGSCNTMTADSVWGSACLTDSDCARNPGAPRRCAYYSTVTDGANDVRIYRCRKLIDEGERGCRSRWDCIDNYKSTTAYDSEGWFPWRDPTPLKCYSGEGSAVGRCCGPNTKECKRPGFVNTQGQGQLPTFENCGQALQCPKGMEMFCVGYNAGGDGGGDSGDGGDASGSSGSNGSSSSSASSCSNTNKCIAIVKNGNNYTWVVPASCPLTGSKRTCYSQCLAGLGAGSTLTTCEARCNISESDLGMCPCKSDYDECAFTCATERQQCNISCASNSACLQSCLYTQTSCVQACGRRCPNSSGSSGSQRTASSQVSSQISNKSVGSNGPSSGGTSSSRSSSSSSISVSSPSGSTGSNGSNGSIGSNQSLKSSQGFSESFSSKKSNGSNSSHNSNTSNSTSRSSGGSAQSSSSSSSSSSVINGVCCSAGNCDPFGRCSNPFANYASCLAVCGGESSQSNRSSSSLSVSSSQSSKNSTSSGGSNSSSSVSTRSTSSTSSSRSSTSSSLRSSSSSSRSSTSSSASSRSSSGNNAGDDAGSDGGNNAGTTGGNTGVGGTIGGSTTGVGGEIGTTVSGFSGDIGGISTGQTSSRGIYGNNSSVYGACVTDAQCAPGQRCILNRCLTALEIAQLPSFCGNGRLDPGEICDEGVENSDRPNASCRTNCTPARCGDGIIDTPLEQCDDGDIRSGDGCSATCLPERAAPPATLPATTIELPLTNTNKGDLGSINDGTSGIDSVNGGVNAGNGSIPSSIPSTPDTGPAALAVMLAGGAAGWLYRRRK